MFNEILVSVVMPCHNSEKFVQQAISSVLNQSHQNVQLIVVDDGSDDSTVELVQQFADERITLLQRSDGSGGPAVPRNQGLAIATGRYVAFIDSDDVWHKDKILSQLKVMCANGLDFCSTLYKDFVGDDCHSGGVLEMSVEIKFTTHRQLLKKNIVATSIVLMTYELAQKLSFEESSKYIAVEDYLAWLYLHQLPDIRSAVLLQELVFYRLREDSISSSKLTMAKKVFVLLDNYKVDGTALGVVKYLFFTQYVITGCYLSVMRWCRRILG